MWPFIFDTTLFAITANRLPSLATQVGNDLFWILPFP